MSDDTIYRALKDLGFSHVSARPKAYKQDADAMAAFKKTLPYAWRKSARHPPGTPVEIWFQDEMRVGQTTNSPIAGPEQGSRPRAIHDQRTQSTYLFGAVCPSVVEPALPSCCPLATPRPCSSISTKSHQSHPRRTRRSHSRSSWMARRQRPQGSQKHLAPAAAAACAGAQPARKYLAIHAGELAVEPHLQIL